MDATSRLAALDAKALEIATAIHLEHRSSYWAQRYLLQRIGEELGRLDNEAHDVQLPLFREGGSR